MLAPGRRNDPVQFIDVRDLAEFMVHLLENGQQRRVQRRRSAGDDDDAGIPRAGAAALGSEGELSPGLTTTIFSRSTSIEEAIPWAMLKGNDDGMMSIGHERAEAAGLKYRPLAATVRDTLRLVEDGARKHVASHRRFAISPEQESQALAAWHARKPVDEQADTRFTGGHLGAFMVVEPDAAQLGSPAEFVLEPGE